MAEEDGSGCSERVRLEGGDEEADEVQVEGEEMEGWKPGDKGHWEKGRGHLMLTTLGLHRAGSDYWDF